MYNALLSLAVGILVTLALKLAGFSFLAAIVPGTLAFLGAFVLLARRIVVKVQAIASQAQKELAVQVSSQKEQKVRAEKAVKILEDGLVYDKWQFLIAAELHGQIGMIKYLTKDYDGAQASFGKASPRNYMAKAMQGALYYQRKDLPKMEEAFENAVKNGKKEGLVWAVYAWCLAQLKEKDKALRIMARAVDANPTDEKLKSGLQALQNDKKLKMKPYEPMWWQFGLEQPPMAMGNQRRVQFQRH
jgi:tetratricopeptide (TPR) repeat protein